MVLLITYKIAKEILLVIVNTSISSEVRKVKVKITLEQGMKVQRGVKVTTLFL